MQLRTWLMTGAFLFGTALAHDAVAKKPKKDAAPPPAPAAPAAPPAPKAETAKVEMKLADGRKVGDITLEQTPNGVVVSGELENLPPGTHAFHIHEVGKCEAPFKTAGGHFNPEGHKHGIKAEGGKHAGDMPNLYVPESGKIHVEFFAPDFSIKEGGTNYLFDADGSAVMIHEKVDDLKSDPTGDAGGRIACGVVAK